MSNPFQSRSRQTLAGGSRAGMRGVTASAAAPCCSACAASGRHCGGGDDYEFGVTRRRNRKARGFGLSGSTADRTAEIQWIMASGADRGVAEEMLTRPTTNLGATLRAAYVYAVAALDSTGPQSLAMEARAQAALESVANTTGWGNVDLVSTGLSWVSGAAPPVYDASGSGQVAKIMAQARETVEPVSSRAVQLADRIMTAEPGNATPNLLERGVNALAEKAGDLAERVETELGSRLDRAQNLGFGFLKDINRTAIITGGVVILVAFIFLVWYFLPGRRA